MEQILSLDQNPLQSRARTRVGLMVVLLGTVGYGAMLTSYLESFGRAVHLVAPACIIYGFLFLWKVKRISTRPALAKLTGLLVVNMLALFNAGMLAVFYFPLLEQSFPEEALNRPVFFILFYGIGLELAKLERWLLARLMGYLPWAIRRHYYLFLDPHRVYHAAIHEAGHYLYALKMQAQGKSLRAPVARLLFRNRREGRIDIDDIDKAGEHYIKMLLAGGIAETLFFGFQKGNNPLKQNSDYGQLRSLLPAGNSYASLIPQIIDELQGQRGRLERWANQLVTKGCIGD